MNIKEQIANATYVILEKRLPHEDTWYVQGKWPIEKISNAANAAHELGKVFGTYQEVRFRFE